MRLCAVLCVALLAHSALADALADCGSDRQCLWAEYKRAFNKHYATEAEESKRYSAFLVRADEIDAQRVAHPHTGFGFNKNSDLTKEEFASRFYTLSADAEENWRRAPKMRMDLRKRAPVPSTYTSPWATPAQDQKQCGSCWTFSAMGVAEGAWKKVTGNTEHFGPQQIIDCMPGSKGCSGGDPRKGLEYLVNSTGQGYGCLRDSDYPYKESQGTCTAPLNKAVGKLAFTFTLDWDEVTDGTTDTALYKNSPLAVMLDAHMLDNYQNGIIYNDPICQQGVNHAVLLIGWGVENGAKYWLIKNSWGATWGESGSFRIARGSATCKLSGSTGAVAVGGSFGGGTQCGAKTCSTIDVGTDTNTGNVIIPCGNCAPGFTCNGAQTCNSMVDSTQWVNMIGTTGYFTPSTNSSTVTISTSGTGTDKHFIRWTSSNNWMNKYWSSFKVKATATASGIIGLGINTAVGSSNGIWWKIGIPTSYSGGSSATADVMLCTVSGGTSTCQPISSSFSFPMKTAVSLSANFMRNSGKVACRLYVNGVSVTSTNYISVPSTNIPDVAEYFIVSSGAGKTFSNPDVESRVTFTATNDQWCVGFDQWKGILGEWLGLDFSSILSISTPTTCIDSVHGQTLIAVLADAASLHITGTWKLYGALPNRMASHHLYQQLSSMIAANSDNINYLGTWSGLALLEFTLAGSATAYNPTINIDSATSCTATLFSGASWNTCYPDTPTGTTCQFTCPLGYTAQSAACSSGVWTPSVGPTCIQGSPCSASTSGMPSGTSLNNCSASTPSGTTCQFSCPLGYVPKAATCVSGTWSPSAPSCTQGNPCSLNLPSGATYNTCAASTVSGKTCQLTCPSGWNANSGTCNSGVWSPSTPTCTQGASCPLSLPSGAAYNDCSSNTVSGKTCSLTCPFGWTASSATCISGAWSPAAPSCTQGDSCQTSLSGTPSGTAMNTCSISTPSGTTCKFTCPIGYTASSATCSFGSWSPEGPKCIQGSPCTATLPQLSGAALNTCQASTPSGTTCQFTCPAGYTPTSATCNSGSWTPYAPMCSLGDPCPLTLPLGAAWNNCSDNTPSGATCILTCPFGYTAKGATCNAGSWSPSTPSCTRGASCPISGLPSGASLNNCSYNTLSGTTCQLKCPSGTSPKPATCAFGVWSPSQPDCTANPCPASLPAGAQWNGCTANTPSGTTCQFICPTGYTAQSSSCSYGSWSPEAPKCNPNPCSLTLPATYDWNNCSQSVPSGSSCMYTCPASLPVAMPGTCQASKWNPPPSCVSSPPQPCALTLPAGASWNTCQGSSVQSGATCELSCPTGFDANSGSCTDGSWNHVPTCTNHSNVQKPKKGGLGTGATAGIAAAACLIPLVGIGAALLFYRRAKQNREGTRRDVGFSDMETASPAALSAAPVAAAPAVRPQPPAAKPPPPKPTARTPPPAPQNDEASRPQPPRPTPPGKTAPPVPPKAAPAPPAPRNLPAPPPKAAARPPLPPR